MATAFAYKWQEVLYLISNWHVVSGRDAETGQPLDRNGAIPDRLRILFHIQDRLGSWRAAEVPLLDSQGDPIWLQHPIQGQKIDVAAVPLNCPPGLTAYPLNEYPMQDQMRLGIGNDVFVLGYPLNIRAEGVFPIWKRASISSEPDIDYRGLPALMVDTATYKGMSGAPVISRSWGGYMHQSGGFVVGGGISDSFVGVYSGRMIGENQEVAQLGLVWKARVIQEILEGRARGSFVLQAAR